MIQSVSDTIVLSVATEEVRQVLPAEQSHTAPAQ
jgi:hypothetical protein